jgi:signal peptidase I
MVIIKVMTKRTDFFDRIQETTEGYLGRRRRLRRLRKEKLRKKNQIIDWIEAFLWAAGVVLLINQYLFQAYQIPSGSMIDTLLIQDRIFVNKLVFGPELLPGIAKMPSPVKPKRNDVIIFENPSYISRGPVFDITQRIIYMLTLSFVNIDREANGDPKAHFLIKRAAGMGGDRFVSDRGNMLVRFAGEDRWAAEGDYNASSGFRHRLSRLVPEEAYPLLGAAGRAAAFEDMGLAPPEDLSALGFEAASLQYPDYFAYERSRLEVLRGAFPQDNRYRALLARQTMGWYIPPDYVFPRGDNRDNSRDGRYFGPIQKKKVLGKGSFIYWPLGRMGLIR